MMPLNNFAICSRVNIITQFLLGAQSTRKLSVPAVSIFCQVSARLTGSFECFRSPL